MIESLQRFQSRFDLSFAPLPLRDSSLWACLALSRCYLGMQTHNTPSEVTVKRVTFLLFSNVDRAASLSRRMSPRSSTAERFDYKLKTYSTLSAAIAMH
jgi:hypothetical protein